MAVLRQYTLKQAGFEVDTTELAFVRDGDTHLNRTLEEAEREVAKRKAALDGVSARLSERLSSALRLLDRAEADEIEGIEEKRSATERLLPCASAFEKAAPLHSQLFDAFESLKSLLQNVQGHEEDDAVLGKIQGLVVSTCDLAQEMRAGFGACEYPFETAQETKLLRDAAVPDIPSTTNAVDNYRMTEQILSDYNDLFVRVMGNLALIAQAVETHLLEEKSQGAAT